MEEYNRSLVSDSGGQCPCPDCIFAMQGSHLRRSPAATHRCLAPCPLPLSPWSACWLCEGVPLIVNFKSSLPCGDTGRVLAAVLQCCSAISAATTRPSQDIEKLLAIFGQLYWYIEGYLQFCAVATTTTALHSLQCLSWKDYQWPRCQMEIRLSDYKSPPDYQTLAKLYIQPCILKSS